VLIGKLQPRPLDSQRDLIVPGDNQKTLTFCVEHFIAAANAAIKDHGAFYVALSGGSTPKAIFQLLTNTTYDQLIKWSNVHLFWSDERAVKPDDPDSNYQMAMAAGLSKMGIPSHQIHRMHAETEIEKNALAYERKIQDTLRGRPFDLVMLGMGEDGHTASLFPSTEGLAIQDRLVIANYIPQKKTWRMSMTFFCINQAKQIAIYVLGASKKKTLAEVLSPPYRTDLYPVLSIGTPTHHALWIADEAAAEELLLRRKS
jgi:6-phosphogluconolactonase